MSARSIRRASERKAQKLAPKEAATAEQPCLPAAELETVSSEIEEPSVAIATDRAAINCANSQHSTGPKSPDKATSSRNAVKTALTGRTVLLPSDDAERYESHLAHYAKLYTPLGDQENTLVQSLADTMWRLDRIPGLEEALYIRGCIEFAAKVAELDPEVRATMLRVETYLAYERQFRNLNIQEARLHRQREKLIVEIAKLQEAQRARMCATGRERNSLSLRAARSTPRPFWAGSLEESKQKEREEFDAAAKLYIKAKSDRKSFDPADYGFEFSIADIEGYLEGVRARQLTEKAFASGNFALSQRTAAA